MSIFEKCKHEWELIINEYEKSQLQKMNERGIIMTNCSLPLDFSLGRKIIILQCKKCGKLDKTIEEV